jgi:hypothetical protein
MSEYVKDSTRATGWKVVSYSGKGKKKDDGAPVTADGMDEGGSDGSEGDAEPDRAGTTQWLLE